MPPAYLEIQGCVLAKTEASQSHGRAFEQSERPSHTHAPAERDSGSHADGSVPACVCGALTLDRMRPSDAGPQQLCGTHTVVQPPGARSPCPLSPPLLNRGAGGSRCSDPVPCCTGREAASGQCVGDFGGEGVGDTTPPPTPGPPTWHSRPRAPHGPPWAARGCGRRRRPPAPRPHSRFRRAPPRRFPFSPEWEAGLHVLAAP